MADPKIINSKPPVDPDFKLPMGMEDILTIVQIVEDRLRVHLPNLERWENEDKTLIYLRNPLNDQKAVLFETFYPASHGSVGYRCWTLEAIPELLHVLMKEKGPLQ